NDVEALVEWQAGLDAAHDDVDRVGELVEEFRLAALDQAGDEPARQAQGADEGRGDRDQRVHARQRNIRDRAEYQAGDDAHDPERARRDVEARTLEPHAHRQLLALLLLLLELLQRFRNLPAPIARLLDLRRSD